MGILIDVVLVAIVILNVILGYKKGLIHAIFNICAFFIAIIITVVLYKPVSNIVINNTDIVSKIQNVIVENNTQETNREAGLQNYIENIATDAKNHSIEVIAESISYKIVEIGVAITLFIASRIIVILLKFITESIAELPIIKQFNKAGGLVYGCLKAVIIVYVLLTVLFIVVSINGNGVIASSIESSYITNFLYKNNPIVKYCFLGKSLL